MSSYLNELSRFYERMSMDPSSGMPPEGMTAEQISFVLVIGNEGQLVGVKDLRDSKGHPVRIFVPASVKRTSNPVSNFLWDNTGYVLGVDGKGKPKKTMQAFETFQALHKEILSSCESVHAKALLAFLEKWNPQQFENLENREALLDKNVIFKLESDDRYFHEVKELRNLWLKRQNKASQQTNTGVCLISGRSDSVALTHPSIKGVFGAQSSGAALVSFNCPAFTSYGKTQNENAPVSESAARAYTSALNYLLQREHSQTVRIGDTSMVFWCEKSTPAEKLFGDFFDLTPESEPEQDKNQLDHLKGILLAIRKGNPLNEADKALELGARFYVLGLAPNAARISVRYWLTDTLEALLKHVSRWYEDLSIERQYPDTEPEFPPLWRLLKNCIAAQEKSENIPPELAAQMAKAFLSSSIVPENVFTSVLQRIHADKKMNYYRAALIKAYLRRNHNEEKNMSTLNIEEQSEGYRLGRLFALLEKTQKDSLGSVNAPLRERYIGSASATPRLVFPMLLRLTQHHVTKAIKTKSSGYEIFFNKMMDDILGGMTDFPATLPLAEQGRFMLGYYHQTNALYQKKSDATEAGE